MNSSKIFLIICLLSLSGCAHVKQSPPKAAAALVELKIVYRGQPVTGAAVYFFPKTANGFAEKPLFTSPFTTEDGKARLTIPSGSYYLIALRKKIPGGALAAAAGDLFCFYGGNPLFFAPEEKWQIGLNAQLVSPIKSMKTPAVAVGASSGIRGGVTFQNQPLAGAEIYVYLDGATNFRGPGNLELLNLGADGRFNLELPPGQYYLVAKKRSSAEWAGPLERGDYFGYLPQNPLTVSEGEFLEVDLECVAKTKSIKPKTLDYLGVGITAISGIIHDKTGKPLRGAFAFAYENAAMNGQRPPYISPPTGPDGRYVLAFDKAGRYYLGARNTTGGPPMPGDLYGEYAGNANHVVELQEGQVMKNIDLYLKEME